MSRHSYSTLSLPGNNPNNLLAAHLNEVFCGKKLHSVASSLYIIVCVLFSEKKVLIMGHRCNFTGSVSEIMLPPSHNFYLKNCSVMKNATKPVTRPLSQFL